MKTLLPILLTSLVWTSAIRAEGPDWWAAQGVLNTSTADDYAVVNQGQLKFIAQQAAAEMDYQFETNGAGSAIDTMISGFVNTNNYLLVNQGQLKNVVKPFYDRLGPTGLDSHTGVPWTAGGEDDYALANIGMVKNLFSFEIPNAEYAGDSDNDGLLDSWEQAHFSDLDETITSDPDGDGLNNYAELHYQTDPNDDDSDNDGFTDDVEVAAGTDPNDAGSYPGALFLEIYNPAE